MFKLRTLWLNAILCALLLSAAGTAVSQTRAVVDWSRPTDTVNRALFSSQGFMQVYKEPDPMVMETFKLLNPQGTQTRLETWTDRLEPVNDNDDPNVFNWDKLHPERMIRMIEDRDTFRAVYHDELGMEPLSLITYNHVAWNKSGDLDAPIKDIQEWVEFAAAVVESYNGSGEDYRPRLRLVQVWNEPNMDMFYTGTKDSYYELFNAVAERIHRDYPGVMVGGPTITHSGKEPQKWLDEFIRQCGHNADFIIFHHYGPQGEGYKVLTDEVQNLAKKMRAIPGKENAKVMITETDGWFAGWAKAQFILGRQFDFIDHEDLILAIHHFCSLAYNETGSHTFGIVDQQGGVIEGTFWPYWFFRNYIGEEVYTLREGDRQGDFRLLASRHENSNGVSQAAFLWNQDDTELPVETLLYFDPSESDRVLVYNKVTEGFKGVERVESVPAGEDKVALSLNLEPGEALSLVLQETGKRHFAFRDLNNQETPWIAQTASETQISYGETVRFAVEIRNTLQEPVSGKLQLGGIPESWPVTLVEGEETVENLPFNGVQRLTYEIKATTLVPGENVGIYTVLDDSNIDGFAHSIPTSVKVTSPVTIFVLPTPVYTIPGEENQFEVQITRQTDEPWTATASVEFPEGFELLDGPVDLEVADQKRDRFTFSFMTSSDMEPGTYTAQILLEFLGTTERRPVTIVVEDRNPVEDPVFVDLKPYFNFDPLCFQGEQDDVTPTMGMFRYPADHTPMNRVVKSHGIPFRLESFENGEKAAVLPQGQKIDVPAGEYSKAHFVAFGLDGKHPGTWRLHYADGTAEDVQSEVPEWCVDPPAGTLEAFVAPHRYLPSGPAAPACQFWIWPVEVDDSKELTAIEMPTFEHGAYFFAITMEP